MSLSDEEREYIGLVAREAAHIAVEEIKIQVAVNSARIKWMWVVGGGLVWLTIDKLVDYLL